MSLADWVRAPRASGARSGSPPPGWGCSTRRCRGRSRTGPHRPGHGDRRPLGPGRQRVVAQDDHGVGHLGQRGDGDRRLRPGLRGVPECRDGHRALADRRPGQGRRVARRPHDAGRAEVEPRTGQRLGDPLGGDDPPATRIDHHSQDQPRPRGGGAVWPRCPRRWVGGALFAAAAAAGVGAVATGYAGRPPAGCSPPGRPPGGAGAGPARSPPGRRPTGSEAVMSDRGRR